MGAVHPGDDVVLLLVLAACAWLAPGEPSEPLPGPATPGTPQRLAADAPLPADAVCDRPRPDHGCFRPVAGGTLHMGAQATDPDGPGYDPLARPDEAPVHDVAVAAFQLQAYEVLARDVQACLAAGWCDPAEIALDGGFSTVGVDHPGTLPATGLTWQGARRYCAWLGARLPTEAEWAWAARGAEGRRFPWGDDTRCVQIPNAAEPRELAAEARLQVTCGPLEDRIDREAPQAQGPVYNVWRDRHVASHEVAVCARLADAPIDDVVAALQADLDVAPAHHAALPCEHEGPTTVENLREPTPTGFWGLAGSVWEWTEDRYAPYPGSTEASPAGPVRRVQRGGAWTTVDPFDLRAAARGAMVPDARLPDVGVRCARDR